MKNSQKIIAQLGGKGDKENSQCNSNTSSAQRARLLAALRLKMVSTISARSELDILAPAARIWELRHNFGHDIDSVWVEQTTSGGKSHRVVMYVLRLGGSI